MAIKSENKGFLQLKAKKMKPNNQIQTASIDNQESSPIGESIYSPVSDLSSEFQLRAKKYDEDICEGRWTDHENLKFVSFLLFHRNILASSQGNKKNRIFKKASTFMETRIPAQCRSHYQKLMKKHKTLTDFYRHFERVFGMERIESQFAKIGQMLGLEKSEIEEKKVEKESVGIQTDLAPIHNYLNYTHLFHSWAKMFENPSKPIKTPWFQ